MYCLVPPPEFIINAVVLRNAQAKKFWAQSPSDLDSSKREIYMVQEEAEAPIKRGNLQAHIDQWKNKK